MKHGMVQQGRRNGSALVLVVLAGTGAGLGVPGCGGTNPEMIDALDGIVASKQSLSGGQTGVMSLHSLAVEPGVLIKMPTSDAKMKPGAIVEHTDAPHSALRVETYEGQLTVADMQTIRTAIDTLTASVGVQIGNRLDEAKAKADERKSNNEVDKAIKAKSENDAKAADVTKARLDVASRTLDTIRATGMRPELVQDLSAVTDAVRAAPPASDQAVQAAKEQSSKAQAVTDQKTKNVKDKSDSLDSEQQKLLKAISKPNVVVFRWNTGAKDSGGFDLFGKASADASRKKQTQGYAVLNGLRRVRLVVGKDFETAGQSQAAAALGGMAGAPGLVNSPDGVIVTHVLQTHDIMYLAAEDLEERIKASLELKASDLTGAGLTPEEIADLKIKASYEALRLSSLQNSGYFTAPRVDMIELTDLNGFNGWDRLRVKPNKPLAPWRGTGATDNAGGLAEDPEHDWITLYAVTTSVQELLAQRRRQ